MKLLKIPAILIGLGFALLAQAQTDFLTSSNAYLGQTKPGTTPVVFASGIVSNGQINTTCSFSPDGKELFFTRWDSSTSGSRLFYCKFENGSWTAPVEKNFTGYPEMEAIFSPNGDQVYFASMSPRTWSSGRWAPDNIWVAERTSGTWGNARAIDAVNTSEYEFYATLTTGKTMYFERINDSSPGSIYSSECVNGTFSSPVLLSSVINSGSRDHHPCISPDGSFLIWESYRTGGSGTQDLWISFKKSDGTWTTATTLGTAMSALTNKRFPTLSPDGKYLFFQSGNDIYWVSTQCIEVLRKQYVPETVAGARQVGTVHALGHSAVKIVAGSQVIYIDPYRLTTSPADADIVLITHDHYDHLSTADIRRVAKNGTRFVAASSCVSTLQSTFGGTVTSISPGSSVTVNGITIDAVLAYNITKTQYHPRSSNYVGFVVTVDGVKVYHAGDTERIPEMANISCDVAMVPLGQTYTMNTVQDAVNSVLDVKATSAIPIHWGVEEGTQANANTFASSLLGKARAIVSTDSGYPLYTFDAVVALAIGTQPQNLTIETGKTARFSVSTVGSGTITYQWQRLPAGTSLWANLTDDSSVSGSKSAKLAVSSTTATMSGDQFRCVVSNGTDPTVTSNAVTLSFGTNRFSALSVRGVAGSGDQTLIVGAVFSGSGTKSIVVRGLGPALASQGVAGTLADPRLTVYDLSGQSVATNDNWGGSSALSTAFSSLGLSSLPSASLDAALLVNLPGPVYTVHVTGTNSTSGVVLAELYDAEGSNLNRQLGALSVRNQVGSGDNVLIAGIIIEGSASKTLIIRGLGPALASQGVNSSLADPTLSIYRFVNGSMVLTATNDNWGGTSELKTAFSQVGLNAPADNSLDSALLITLEPGIYTANLSGVSDQTGVGLIEVYQAQ